MNQTFKLFSHTVQSLTLFERLNILKQTLDSRYHVACKSDTAFRIGKARKIIKDYHISLSLTIEVEKQICFDIIHGTILNSEHAKIG